MRIFLLFALVFSLFCGCACLPEFVPVEPDRRQVLFDECARFHIQGDWQWIHSIEVTMTGGRKSMMIGVVNTSSMRNNLRCVIMTVEGLVLFQAGQGEKLVVERSLPPFDSPNFAKGLVEDIRLLFFAPEGKMRNAGLNSDGCPICRYSDGKKSVTDIIRCPEGGWVLNKYKEKKLVKRIKAGPNPAMVLPDGRIIPRHIELRSFGTASYQLELTLMRAVEKTETSSSK